MIWLRKWRESSEAMTRHGILVAIGVVVIGVLGLIWMQINKGGAP